LATKVIDQLTSQKLVEATRAEVKSSNDLSAQFCRLWGTIPVQRTERFRWARADLTGNVGAVSRLISGREANVAGGMWSPDITMTYFSILGMRY